MKIYLLKDIVLNAKGVYGISASACSFNKDFPQYIRITDITDDGRYLPTPPVSIDPQKYPDYANYYLRNGDIVFARTGSIGLNYFYKPSDGKLVFAGYLIKFSVNPAKIIPEYVKYFCQTKQYYDWVLSSSNGTTRKNLNAQDYGLLPIPMMSRAEQQHIVDLMCLFIAV
jgi:restriction endonuclease S subunit